MDGAIMSVPIGGGSPATIASGQAEPQAMAVDATTLYWVNNAGNTANNAGMVMKLAKP
jgi:hypothetical protein